MLTGSRFMLFISLPKSEPSTPSGFRENDIILKLLKNCKNLGFLIDIFSSCFDILNGAALNLLLAKLHEICNLSRF